MLAALPQVEDRPRHDACMECLSKRRQSGPSPGNRGHARQDACMERESEPGSSRANNQPGPSRQLGPSYQPGPSHQAGRAARDLLSELRQCNGVYQWDGCTPPGAFSPGQVRQWFHDSAMLQGKSGDLGSRGLCSVFLRGLSIDAEEFDLVKRIANVFTMATAQAVDLVYRYAQLHVEFVSNSADEIFLRQHIRLEVPTFLGRLSTRWRLVLCVRVSPSVFYQEMAGIWDCSPVLIPDFLDPATPHIARICKFFVQSPELAAAAGARAGDWAGTGAGARRAKATGAESMAQKVAENVDHWCGSSSSAHSETSHLQEHHAPQEQRTRRRGCSSSPEGGEDGRGARDGVCAGASHDKEHHTFGREQRLPAPARGAFPHTVFEFNEGSLVQKVAPPPPPLSLNSFLHA